jgi:hypothetical protein
VSIDLLERCATTHTSPKSRATQASHLLNHRRHWHALDAHRTHHGVINVHKDHLLGHRCLTFDMSGDWKRAKHAGGRPLDGGVGIDDTYLASFFRLAIRFFVSLISQNPANAFFQPSDPPSVSPCSAQFALRYSRHAFSSSASTRLAYSGLFDDCRICFARVSSSGVSCLSKRRS